jgi:hypothetical protein
MLRSSTTPDEITPSLMSSRSQAAFLGSISL